MRRCIRSVRPSKASGSGNCSHQNNPVTASAASSVSKAPSTAMPGNMPLQRSSPATTHCARCWSKRLPCHANAYWSHCLFPCPGTIIRPTQTANKASGITCTKPLQNPSRCMANRYGTSSGCRPPPNVAIAYTAAIISSPMAFPWECCADRLSNPTTSVCAASPIRQLPLLICKRSLPTKPILTLPAISATRLTGAPICTHALRRCFPAPPPHSAISQACN